MTEPTPESMAIADIRGLVINYISSDDDYSDPITTVKAVAYMKAELLEYQAAALRRSMWKD